MAEPQVEIPLDQVLRNLSERLDEDLIPLLYESASVPTPVIRGELEADGLAFFDPRRGPSPSLQELRRSAERVVSLSSRTAAIRGAMAGSMGLFAIPPEVAAAFVQTLRMGQRLVVLFGHEHETDRGKLILGRALAAALELELPEQARVDFRVRQLPDIIRPNLPEGRSVATKVARATGRRVVRTITGRLGRAIPGFGAGVGAWGARRTAHAQAERMLPVLEATWEGAPWSADVVEEAEEIPSTP